MITLPKNLMKQFAEFYAKIKSGELKTLIPLLPLFEINGKPMGLTNHFQLAPMFNVVQPQQMLFMLSRQNGKSVSLCTSAGLRSMLIPNYHIVLVQPQFEMIKRLNNTIYQPILRSCPIINHFITSTELSKMTLKVFKNNSMTFMEHAYMSPDRLRGISGASAVYVDETVWENEPIYVIDKRFGALKKVPIKTVKAGDFILSCNFCDGEATISVVTKDASFHGYRNYFKVTTETGRSLTCTADHTLPTNRGPMRIGDIIDDLYSRTSGCNRDVRGAGKCDHGEYAGRRLLPKERREHEGHTLESWSGTRGLRDSQVRSLTRVRYASSVSDRESRLRGLLGGPVPEGAPDISLYVHPDAARGLREENCHCGILERDHTPDCSGVVVHGRWEQDKGLQQWAYTHKRIQRGRSESSVPVADCALGSGSKAMHGETQQYWQLQPHNCSASRWLPCSDGPDLSICSGVHGIQDQGTDKDMQTVWEDFYCSGPDTILLQRMQGYLGPSTCKGIESSLCTRTPGRETRICCQIQRGTQRGASREGTRLLCQYDRRTESTQSCTDICVAESQQGSYQRGTQRMAQEQEGRPGIRSAAEGRTFQVLSAQETGSRAISTHSGTAEDRETEARAQSTRESLSCKARCHEADQRAGRICSEDLLEGYVWQDEKYEARAAAGVHSSLCNRACGGTLEDDPERSCSMAPVPADAEWVGDFFLDRIVNIEYVGVLPGYDIEVEGTHNYVLANGILSKNCQDMNWDFIPIIEECMSASINWGFSIYTGTPKTTDNTLARLWSTSSQAEWVIRCDACGFFNIPNPEQHLLKMVGKHGPICAKCGHPLVIEHGGWVHGYPEKALTFPSWHLAQVVHKLHSINEMKWRKLVHKIETLPETTLNNEIFGWPYDDATTPLTLTDLINAEYDPIDQYGTKVDIKVPSDVRKVAHNYSYISLGCDWGGGSAISDSYTAFALVGLRKDNQVMDILYSERIQKGVSPTDEAKILMSWITGAHVNAFTFDNGGAGFVRTEIMKHEGLADIVGLKVIPQQYGPPRGGDVMRLAKAQREADLTYYITDKSRSLAMCIAGIKAKRIRVRRFNHDDESEPIRDFLALIEDPRDIRGRDVVILIGRKASQSDDLAHAVNFACTQIGDALGAYLPIGRRYDTSRLEPLVEEEIPEVYGPRGDFERFQDAISANCAIVEPDYDDFY